MSQPLRITVNCATRTLCRRNLIAPAIPVSEQLRNYTSKAPKAIFLPLRPVNCLPNHARAFSNTAALAKKKKEKSSNASTTANDTGDDPFDFSLLTERTQHAVTRLKEDISKLRAGGRLNPEVIENVRVSLKTSTKDKQTVKLSEVAQVLPKGGRMITILVSEEEYTKAITSALQGVPSLSLNPQHDPHNPLQLNLPIPPPTRESREESLKEAKAALERAGTVVKEARANINKKLKAMGNKKAVGPDDLRKALDQMEKLAAKGQKEVKDAFEAAKKALERE